MTRGQLMPATLALLAVISTGCVSRPRDRGSVDAIDAIRAARSGFNAAIARHDALGIAMFLGPDYHIVSSRNAQTSGRDANQQMWSEIFASQPGVTYVRTSTAIRVYEPWGMAEESGSWSGRWRAADGDVEIRGSYVAKWQKDAMHWRLIAEVFTPASCRGGVACRSPALATQR